jgi:hypothetical protein
MLLRWLAMRCSVSGLFLCEHFNILLKTICVDSLAMLSDCIARLLQAEEKTLRLITKNMLKSKCTKYLFAIMIDCPLNTLLTLAHPPLTHCSPTAHPLLTHCSPMAHPGLPWLTHCLLRHTLSPPPANSVGLYHTVAVLTKLDTRSPTTSLRTKNTA